MDALLKNSLIICLMSVALSVHAEIYQHKDKNGNLYFSDQPQSGSVVTTLPTIDSYQTSQKKANPTTDSTKSQVISSISTAANYVTFDISNLANQQTFQNVRVIPVTVNVKPALVKGDIIEIWLNGKLYASGAVTDFILESLDRGTYTLQAKLVNKSGRVIKSTQLLTLYVKYHSVLLPAQSTNYGNIPAQGINAGTQALNPAVQRLRQNMRPIKPSK